MRGGPGHGAAARGGRTARGREPAARARLLVPLRGRGRRRGGLHLRPRRGAPALGRAREQRRRPAVGLLARSGHRGVLVAGRPLDRVHHRAGRRRALPGAVRAPRRHRPARAGRRRSGQHRLSGLLVARRLLSRRHRHRAVRPRPRRRRPGPRPDGPRPGRQPSGRRPPARRLGRPRRTRHAPRSLLVRRRDLERPGDRHGDGDRDGEQPAGRRHRAAGGDRAPRRRPVGLPDRPRRAGVARPADHGDPRGHPAGVRPQPGRLARAAAPGTARPAGGRRAADGRRERHLRPAGRRRGPVDRQVLTRRPDPVAAQQRGPGVRGAPRRGPRRAGPARRGVLRPPRSAAPHVRRRGTRGLRPRAAGDGPRRPHRRPGLEHPGGERTPTGRDLPRLLGRPHTAGSRHHRAGPAHPPAPRGRHPRHGGRRGPSAARAVGLATPPRSVVGPEGVSLLRTPGPRRTRTPSRRAARPCAPSRCG